MSRLARITMAFSAFLLIGADATAEIYKWVDRDGVVHYGDQTNAETRTAKTFHPSINTHLGDSATEDKAQTENDEKSDSVNRDAQPTAKARDDEARDSEGRCSDAKKRISLLNTQVPIYIDDQGNYRPRWSGDSYKGERQYIDDDARKAELERMQAQVEKYCASP